MSVGPAGPRVVPQPPAGCLHATLATFARVRVLEPELLYHHIYVFATLFETFVVLDP